MSLIFISYRRDDSAPYAGRLYDRLTARFGKGQVFMDIDQIDPGEDFVEVIERKVGACGIAVVLIGKAWLSTSDAAGRRRLDDPEDFVRLEVAAALQRNIKVLPVLVGGATMPRMQQLPAALATLSRRNAFEISDSRFHGDVDKLIGAIERSADERGGATGTARLGTSTKQRIVVAVSGLGVAVGVAIALAAFWGDLRGPSAKPPVETAAPPVPMATGRLENVSGLLEISRRAAGGSAEAQFDLATAYECGNNKNLPEALHWYELAAAQGHAAAREALTELQTALPTEARDREFRRLQRETRCLAKLQKETTKTLDQMDDKAREAIRKIKPG